MRRTQEVWRPLRSEHRTVGYARMGSMIVDQPRLSRRVRREIEHALRSVERVAKPEDVRDRRAVCPRGCGGSREGSLEACEAWLRLHLGAPMCPRRG